MELYRLTVTEDEQTGKCAEIVRVESSPSSDEKPLHSDPESLPSAPRGAEQLFLGRSVRRIMRYRLRSLYQAPDERCILLSMTALYSSVERRRAVWAWFPFGGAGRRSVGRIESPPPDLLVDRSDWRLASCERMSLTSEEIVYGEISVGIWRPPSQSRCGCVKGE